MPSASSVVCRTVQLPQVVAAADWWSSLADSRMVQQPLTETSKKTPANLLIERVVSIIFFQYSVIWSIARKYLFNVLTKAFNSLSFNHNYHFYSPSVVKITRIEHWNRNSTHLPKFLPTPWIHFLLRVLSPYIHWFISWMSNSYIKV